MITPSRRPAAGRQGQLTPNRGHVNELNMLVVEGAHVDVQDLLRKAVAVLSFPVWVQ